MRCPCGNRVLKGQTRCLSCLAWERRFMTGWERKRVAAPATGAGTKREEEGSSVVGGGLSELGSQPGEPSGLGGRTVPADPAMRASSSRAATLAAITRHPSGRPRLRLVTTDTCPHGQDALTCPGCIEHGERQWEARDGA